MLSHFIARRYLFSPKSHSVINIISGLSTFAISMPIAAMIILLSVFNGFDSLIKGMATTFDADLTISSSQGQTFEIDSLDKFLIGNIDGVDSFSYILEQGALLEREALQTTVTIRGVDDNYLKVLPIDSAVVRGKYEVRLGEIDKLVLGQANGYTLGVRSLVADPVNIYALRRNSFSSLLPFNNFNRKQVGVSAFFALDLESERNYALTSLRLSQSLFNYEGRASSLIVKLSEGSNLGRVQSQLKQLLGDLYSVKSQYELNSTLYNIMIYEKWGIFFISLLVLVIASFSIVGALSMLIIEKRADIKTLRAVGGSVKFIRSIFNYQGLLISFFGALIGSFLGLSITLIQQYFGVVELPSQTFIASSYPVEFRFMDMMVILLSFGVITSVITRLTVGSMINKNSKL